MKYKISLLLLLSILLSVMLCPEEASAAHKKKKKRRKYKAHKVFTPRTDRPDSLMKKWVCVPALPEEAAVIKRDSLLNTGEVYKEEWIHDVCNVYKGNFHANLPDSVNLNLFTEQEDFHLCWYGLQYWGYGKRWGRIHRGLDLYLDIYDSVVSAFEGVVRYARANGGGFGNCVIVRHPNGLETLYGHLEKIGVKENDYVRSGQFLGLGGSTGKSDGPHLHFETRYKGFSFDPALLIDSVSHHLKGSKVHLLKKDLDPLHEPIVTTQNATNLFGKQDPGGSSSGSNSGSKYYIVKKGDTLSEIAHDHQISLSRLRKMNKKIHGDKIRIGQKIRLY